MINARGDYIVLDVETANPKDKGSICSIGIVYMQGKHIVDSFYSLVQPLSEFHHMNIRIHKIRPEDVAEAPTFEQLWPELWPRLKNQTLVAYNATFDIYALERALFNAGIEVPNIRYACALNLTKRLVTLDSYKLTNVSNHFGIYYDAHNALEDATSTAQILQHFFEQHQVESLDALMRLACLPYQYTLTNGYDPALDLARKPKGYIAPKPLAHGNSQFFQGKSVVFSGTLTCASRAIAQQAVIELGGICKTSVSRKTDIVVIGFYDQNTLLPGCSHGQKLLDAIRLRDLGYPVEIIDENDFMEIMREGLE